MNRVAVLLVVGLIGSTTVQAQSPGWVLWERTVDSQSKAGGPSTATRDVYAPQDGYESVAECQDSVRRLISQLETTEPVFLKTMEVTAQVVVSLDRKSIGTIYPTDASGISKIRQRLFLCLPGTLDPRPKSN